jgi:hypothetical protein
MPIELPFMVEDPHVPAKLVSRKEEELLRPYDMIEIESLRNQKTLYAMMTAKKKMKKHRPKLSSLLLIL